MSEGPVRLAAIGLGNRARKYLKYVREHPGEATVVSLVEPNPELLKEMKAVYGLCAKDCFSSCEDFFKKKRNVDALIIATPDETHYDITMKAIGYGYHCLLEKPIANDERECQELVEAARLHDVIVCVCYVLRYHPYYLKIKAILDSGELGPIVSANHVENVGLDRMTHSYVRGIFSNAGQSSPIILSKCSHDIDLLIWLLGKTPRKVASFGHLNWFREENAPEGSAARCVDCPVEERCPFSAVDLYERRRDWISNFVVPEGETIDSAIRRELEEGRYGRCVYRCDNDVVDHQVVAMEMEDGVDVSLTMEALTRKDERVTQINCAYGEILANGQTITVTRFRPARQEVFDFKEINKKPLHANADLKIVEDFLMAVRDPLNHKVRCSIGDALESHLVCFKAEEARLNGKVSRVKGLR